MKTNGQIASVQGRASYEVTQRLIQQQLQHIARRGFTPKPTDASPKGWYKRFRQLMHLGR